VAVGLAPAGDTMIGRGVAERLRAHPGHALLPGDLEAISRESDPDDDDAMTAAFRAKQHSVRVVADMLCAQMGTDTLA
jgi:hypothetical protein